MTWNASLIDGPIDVPIYGEPDEHGARAVIGYVEGYHLNLAPQCMTEALEPFRVAPEAPTRVFAGDDGPAFHTTFLRFDNEVAARAALSAYWITE